MTEEKRLSILTEKQRRAWKLREQGYTYKKIGETIVCASGSVNIRVGNDTKYSRITSVKDGATFEWIATAENGWHAIVVNAQVGWVSGKYSQVV